MVYWADVKNSSNDDRKFHLGVTETPFKECFGNHMRTTSTPNTEAALSYQNFYGNSKMLIYHQLLNRICYKGVTKNVICFL